MIEARNLGFIHKGMTAPTLEAIDFRARRGEVTAVLGPNGSGKTTLFQCLLGVWKQSAGEVLIDGRSIKAMKRPEIARKVAVVPQEHESPFPYSVHDMVLMGRVAHVGLFSTPGKNDEDAALRALAAVGIEPLAERPCTAISGGERQMVLIARCLAQEAPAMLLDEPTAHLDFRNQAAVLEKVRTIADERGLAVLMNIHDPNMALLFAHRAMLLKGGKMLAYGKPGDVINEENMRAMYGMEVQFLTGKGVRMICPDIRARE